MNYFFDTSAVIYLVEKWRLSDCLLRFAQDNELLIPPRVREEFLNGEVEDSNISLVDNLFSLAEVELERSFLPYFDFEATDGAIWVMSCAHRSHGSCCVIDEAFARGVCDVLGVKYTGSIGIIRRLFEKKLLSADEIPGLRERIRDSSFFYNDRVMAEFDSITGMFEK
jgi:predicted nucleic acid-binding protein